MTDPITDSFEVLRAGEFIKNGRRITISGDCLDQAVANFAGPVPLDLDHDGDRRAGELVELERRDGSLYGRARLTAEARKAINSGEYRFFSAAFEQGGEAGFAIHSGALTNRPFIRGLRRPTRPLPAHSNTRRRCRQPRPRVLTRPRSP